MVLEGRLRSINSRRPSVCPTNYFDSNMIQEGKRHSYISFSKNSFAADVARSKCSHTTSSNASVCTYYVDNVNYCSLIKVKFLLG